MTADQLSPAAHLDERIEALTRTVDLLQRELSELRRSHPTHAQAVADVSPEPVSRSSATASRRQMVKLAGAAAVGVVAVVAGSAQQAAAVTGQPLVVGNLNSAANITYLGYGSFANSLGTVLTSEAVMFWADNRNSPNGGATGIRGDGKATGSGLWGNNDFGGVGILGGSAAGIGVQSAGGKAALYLTGTNANPTTRTDAHKAGEIDVDANGNLWFCVAAGSPGSWRKVSGASAAGAFHAISPVRVYDSRWAGDSAILNNTNRTVSVANGRTLEGVVNAPNIVPVGTTAIACNVTVSDTVGSGFLSVAPGTATAITSSAINWSSSGLDLANGIIVAVDGSRQLKVFAGGGGSTHFIIDINGYFL